MHTVRHQHTARTGSLFAATGRLASRARAGLRSLRHAWLARRRRSAARREFARLDGAALRDLALGASEFDSCWAESTGSAPATRRRIADSRAGRSP